MKTRLVETSQGYFEVGPGPSPDELAAFLLNPDTNYRQDRSLGRNCHFARVAFEMGLWRDRSIEAVIEYRGGCAKAGLGRNQTAYARPS